jgi:hypothetical protein
MNINEREPNWDEGCRVGEECPDCLHQRAHFGYELVNGAWVKGAGR